LNDIYVKIKLNPFDENQRTYLFFFCASISSFAVLVRRVLEKCGIIGWEYVLIK